MSALVFMDTETTGLSLDDDIWEFAAIRREEDGTETSLHLFIEHDEDKCSRLPEPFRRDHFDRFPYRPSGDVVSRRAACQAIKDLFGDDRPHVVGAVPNFDTERIARMVRAEWPRWDRSEFWHYHLIDVETLAVGWLYGRHFAAPSTAALRVPDPVLVLPWDSDRLSGQVGVTPPTTERHTAMGDVRWAMALYDAITGAAK